MAITWNSSDKSAGVTLSNGNLTAQGGTGGVRATTGRNSGKWYFEIRFDAVGGGTNTTGLGSSSFSIGTENSTQAWRLGTSGDVYNGSDGTNYWGSGFAEGDIVGIAVDLDNHRLWFAKNNTWVGSPSAGTGAIFTNLSGRSGSLYPHAYFYDDGVPEKQTARFLASSFNYTAPSGFEAWEEASSDVFTSVPALALGLSVGVPAGILDEPSPVEITGEMIVVGGGRTSSITTRTLNASGSAGWSVDHGDTVFAVAIDSDGNIYTGGNVISSKTTRKYNSAGIEQWSVDHGDWVRGIAVDSAGNVYTGGNRTGDLTTRKYNGAGSLQWSVDHEANVYGIAVDSSGNVYTGGNSNGSVTTRKYDSDGDLQWNANHGSVLGIAWRGLRQTSVIPGLPFPLSLGMPWPTVFHALPGLPFSLSLAAPDSLPPDPPDFQLLTPSEVPT